MKRLFKSALVAMCSLALFASCEGVKDVEEPIVLVSEVKISQSTATMVTGQTPLALTVTVAPEDANDKDVEWSVESASVEGCVTVDQSGVVTAVSAGTATVVATSVDGSGVRGECQVTVEDAIVNVASITITPESVTLKVGESETLEATVSPVDVTDGSITWSIDESSDEDCVTLEDGVVSAANIGSATIVATANDGSGVSATCQITVEATKVETITITPQPLTLTAGESSQLSFEMLPADATIKDVMWSVENASTEGCVGVGADGNVVAVKAGTATVVVTALDGSGVRGTCEVTVNAIVYEVGQLYPNAENPVGVVFYTSEDGTSGLVAALNSTSKLKWGPNVDAGMSRVDGMQNMAEVVALDETLETYPLFLEVHEMNLTGTVYEVGAKGVWYVPSDQELRKLYAARCGLSWIAGDGGTIDEAAGTVTDWGDRGYSGMPNGWDYESIRETFDAKFVDAGGEAVGMDTQWSSSQSYNSYAYTVDMYMASVATQGKYNQRATRPVLAF